MQQSIYTGSYLPQQISDRNGACERGVAIFNGAPATNVTLIAAQAGKKIWVPHFTVFPYATNETSVVFKSNSNIKFNVVTHRPSETGLDSRSLIMPYNPIGWFEGEVGQSIVVDVFTGDCLMVLQYFSYIP